MLLAQLVKDQKEKAAWAKHLTGTEISSGPISPHAAQYASASEGSAGSAAPTSWPTLSTAAGAFSP